MALDPIYLSTAIEAALAAGRIQKAAFRRELDVQKKGRIDLVTEVDLEVERRFRALVAERFPTHVVLGEEAAGPAPSAVDGWSWIIDPLDGTTNFAHGLALFSVSIALAVDGQVVVGVVYDPMAEELFTAERGEGARVNGRRLEVSRTTALVDALLVTGFPYSVREDRRRLVEVFAAFLGEAQAVRRLGSAALDLCYVAAGRFEGYWEARIHPWDIAAGSLIVEEAGGTVTGLDGSRFDPFAGHVLASNGHVHIAMLGTIQQAGGRPIR